MAEFNVLKKKNYIFIDVENVGADFTIYNNDSFVYYYVLHNSTRMEEVNEVKRKYPFIHVLNINVTGEQVADMCIYSEICKIHYTVTNPKEFTVVSRDKGFKRFSDTSQISINCIDQDTFQSNMIKEFIASSNLGYMAISNAQKSLELEIVSLRHKYTSLDSRTGKTIKELNNKTNELDDKIKDLTKENRELKDRLESIRALSMFSADVIEAPKMDSPVFVDIESDDILKMVD